MAYFKTKMSEKEYYLAMANRPKKPNSFSEFRGVTKSGYESHPYRSQLSYKGRRYYLGRYKTEIEAAKVYNKAALMIIGDHAIINELPPED